MKIKSDVKLDCTGMVCPQPIVELAKMKKAMEPGQILEMWADDEGAKKDVPNWCDQTGTELLHVEEQASLAKYFIKM